MGWLFSEQSKEQLVARRIRDNSTVNGERSWTHLAHSLRGNTLWSVVEMADISGNRERFIFCDLLAKDKRSDWWGYKDMSECMHPYFYNCPLKFLDMVPIVASEAWREGVRKYHAKRNRKYTVGEVVKLVDGCKPAQVTVTSVKPLRGVADGVLYRIKPSHIAEAS